MTAIAGKQYHGWTREAAILADIYDAINNNTVASGNWRKKPPKIAPYPRPNQKTNTQKRQTIGDLRAMFGGGNHG